MDDAMRVNLSTVALAYGLAVCDGESSPTVQDKACEALFDLVAEIEAAAEARGREAALRDAPTRKLSLLGACDDIEHKLTCLRGRGDHEVVAAAAIMLGLRLVEAARASRILGGG